MNQATKDLISKNQLQDKPEYTEEDLKILADYLKISEDPKAWEVYKQFQYGIGFDPILFECWVMSEDTNESYDYKAIFFQASMDRLPLVLGEDLDDIEDIVLRWRLERHK
jgi:hypothetical protein